MKEQWKDIKGYDGMYKVSNLGNVKSPSKILKIHYTASTGNPKLVITYKGERKLFSVNRLVAEYFLDDYNDLYEVNYKDGDKTNCSAENLYIDYNYFK